jgi:integrase
MCLAVMATLTGLEPATSAVTGRRANQLRHRALLNYLLRVAALQYPLRDSNPRYRLERAAS